MHIFFEMKSKKYDEYNTKRIQYHIKLQSKLEIKKNRYQKKKNLVKFNQVGQFSVVVSDFSLFYCEVLHVDCSDCQPTVRSCSGVWSNFLSIPKLRNILRSTVVLLLRNFQNSSTIPFQHSSCLWHLPQTSSSNVIVFETLQRFQS